MSLRSKDVTDEDLIAGCLADKRDYQEKLYRKYADKMYTICLSYCDDDESACDALQEGFIKVFRKLDTFSFNGSLEGWIRRTIVNTALDHYRKKVKHNERVALYDNMGAIEVDTILDAFNVDDLMKLVNQLPGKAAMVLKLYAIEGFGHKEIAQAMGVTVGTSKSQLNRARSMLRESMNKLDNGR